MTDDDRLETGERWREMWAHFHRLTELDESGRRDDLERIATADPEMGEELRSLLESHETPNPVLDSPEDFHLQALRSDGDADPVDSRIGSRIGAYRLVERLGEGGMGVVYLGERADDRVKQRVAVKLISGSIAHSSLVERLHREREILAHLDHPSIARLIDVGDDPEGRPYVIMEYVDGEPIDIHCDRAQLGLRARLQLMIAVCAAVDAAHRNLVVHRDLKPGNVLVTPEGIPKLVDFGIARRLDRGDATEGASSAFTPRWASPEQLAGDPVTTASDIYSLGLLLCHLLTGGLPYRHADASPPLLAREVLEQRPLRPSTLVGGRHETFLPASDLAGRMRGDLDAIVLHALARDPDERYRTAADLAADLRRHLEGFPIAARPPGPAERLGKLIRRHPWATAAVSAFAVTVLIFVAITGVLNVRLSRSLERLEQEQASSRLQRELALETAGFLKGLFRAATPAQARGREPTVREIVDAGAARLLESGSAAAHVSPATRVELLLTLADVYGSLSDYAEAEALAERAEGLAARLDDPLAVADAWVAQGRIHYSSGDYRTAAERLEAAVAAYEGSVRPGVVPRLASALSDLGAARIGLEQPDLAEDVLLRALELFGDERSQESAVVRLRLGSLERRQEELESARGLLEEAVRDLGSVVGRDHPSTVQARKELADTLRLLGEDERAIAVLEAALADAERVYGSEHADLAPILDRLSLLHQARGELERAEALQRRALDIREHQFGPHSARTVVSVNNLGWLLHDFGRYEEASRLYRRALASGEETLGREHPSVAISLNNIGLLALDRGRFAEARPLLERSLFLLTERLGVDHSARAFPLTNLGLALLEAGEVEGAESLLREALALRRERLPPGHEDLALTLAVLGRLLCENGRAAEGAGLVREALEVERTKNRPGSFGEAVVELELGSCLLASDPERGRRLVETAAPRIEKRRGPADPRLARARRLLTAAAGPTGP